MKANEIVVGGLYLAKVNGRVVTVRVDAVRGVVRYSRGAAGARPVDRTVYDVTNTATGRRTVFRSAAKFRGPAATVPKIPKTPVSPAPAAGIP